MSMGVSMNLNQYTRKDFKAFDKQIKFNDADELYSKLPVSRFRYISEFVFHDYYIKERSLAETGKALGQPKERIRYMMKRWNWPRRNHKKSALSKTKTQLKSDLFERIKFLYQKRPPAHISKQMGISIKEVYKIIGQIKRHENREIKEMIGGYFD